MSLNSTTPSAASQNVTANAFPSLGGFFSDNPQMKALLEDAVRTGDICVVNVEESPISSFEANEPTPATSKSTTGCKVK